MEYRSFQLKILLRILFIFLTLLVLVLAFTGEKYYVTIIVFSVLLILEILELFRFVNRINREVEQFVTAIRKGDLSLNFNPERSGKIFRSLRNSLGEVMNGIEKAKQNAEIQNLYLQMLVDHLDTAKLKQIDYSRFSGLNLKVKNIGVQCFFNISIPECHSVKAWLQVICLLFYR